MIAPLVEVVSQWANIFENITGSTDVKSSTNDELDSIIQEGLFSFIIFALSMGFLALLTPCVFPMIPMTVSFFTKQSKTKAKGITNAIIYGISIIVIYVALGVGVSAIFGADSMNLLATNIYFNIAFFLLLLVFGAFCCIL